MKVSLNVYSNASQWFQVVLYKLSTAMNNSQTKSLLHAVAALAMARPIKEKVCSISLQFESCFSHPLKLYFAVVSLLDRLHDQDQDCLKEIHQFQLSQMGHPL